MVTNSFAFRLCTLAACFVIACSHIFAQDTPTPRQYRPPSEPIPRGWIIAGAALAAFACSAVLYAATKAWRSANLFERKYRFPRGGDAALRFGGNRSGGLMAVIEPKRKSDA